MRRHRCPPCARTRNPPFYAGWVRPCRADRRSPATAEGRS
ncbi:Hypothetical protein A7982_11984 [Minicystis rosea]|nr:Hypothetical protein A7982_11984 [Minicystis rosea]